MSRAPLVRPSSSTNLHRLPASARKIPATPEPIIPHIPLRPSRLSQNHVVSSERSFSAPQTTVPSRAPTPPTAEQNTQRLIRRVFCPDAPAAKPPEELLPALTSSSEVDTELYAILAVVIRDFVLSWYRTFTSDQLFIDEVLLVIAHCTRAIEERLRKVDLVELLFNEVPEILEAHVHDYRQAVARHGSGFNPDGKSIVDIFKSYQPHPALNSKKHERQYFKFVVSGILAILLPTEDLKSDCERTLVRQLLADVVLWNVLDKLSEPFLIYELIAKALVPLQPKVRSEREPLFPEEGQKEEKDPLFREEGVGKGMNGSAKGKEKEVLQKTVKVNQMKQKEDKSAPTDLAKEDDSTTTSTDPPKSLPSWYTTLDRLLLLLFAVVSFLAVFLRPLYNIIIHPVLLGQISPPTHPTRIPLIRTRLPSFLATYSLAPTLQPWLCGILRILSLPFASRRTLPGWVFDDLLHHHLDPYLIKNPAIPIGTIKLLRSVLFPGDKLAPSKPLPTVLEQMEIRRRVEELLVGALGKVVGRRYLLPKGWAPSVRRKDGNTGEREEEEEREEMRVNAGKMYLEIWADKEINKMLVLRIVELVVGKVFPELVESSPSELRKVRFGE